MNTKLRNWIGLRLMEFFAKRNFRIIPLYAERIFEYPWCIMRLNVRSGNIADFGCKGSMLTHYLSACGFRVWGVDLAEGVDSEFAYNYPKFSFCKNDIRSTGLMNDYFDAVFCISTIEHIFKGEDYDDKRVLDEIVRVTKRNGQIFLTMPYGWGDKSIKYLGYPYKIYNAYTLKSLITRKDLIIQDIDYFIKRPPVWIKCVRTEIEYLDNRKETRGTVCVQLLKV